MKRHRPFAPACGASAGAVMATFHRQRTLKGTWRASSTTKQPEVTVMSIEELTMWAARWPMRFGKEIR